MDSVTFLVACGIGVWSVVVVCVTFLVACGIGVWSDRESVNLW
jgi:uncharacterized membrane protein